ncbi:MAG: chloride channel protein, partial [Chloroflexi bacterium]|nr:chloride channel protein [Chloroflexota bacterium]
MIDGWRALWSGARGPGSAAAPVLEQLRSPLDARLLVAAALVGVLGGLGAFVFRNLLADAERLFYGTIGAPLAIVSPLALVLVPALGGILVGALTRLLAPEARGQGIPEVLLAVKLHGGHIRPRVAIVKTVASALCLGSGGSAGQVGPIVQIGASLGSFVGQGLRMRSDHLRLLVACGAGAGIAATFNAPIGGVFFAVEVILADFAVHSFSMVVLSSVVAAVISRATIGDRPAFGVPPYTLGQAWELLLAAALGLLAALVAVGFMRALVGCEALFERWRAPAALKPAVGGLCVGALGLAYAELLGPGFSTIQRVLDGHVTLGASLALVFLKPVATALTLGSGGSGGVFAPSLFIGAVLGSAVGGFAQQVLHLATSPGPAYALLGMAALFAATTRAPVTAIVIIFELTNDYRIILPLMVATAVSVVAAQRLHPESVATMVLARRGIRLPSGLTQNPMDAVRVAEAMTRDFSTVPPDLPLSELATRFSRTGYHGFPVVDRQGRLAGIVTLSDLENAVLQGTPSTDATVRVADIMTTDLIAAYPDETLHQVLSRAGAAHVGRIPV